MTRPQNTLETWIAEFLTDLENANRSPHTCRAYATDLRRLSSFYKGPPEAITAAVLRDFLQTFTHLKPATRARKQAALNSFFAWAYRQDRIGANPLAKLSPVKRDPPQNRALARGEIEKILVPCTNYATRMRPSWSMMA